jgi:D-glycero-D-manno-heptose 1,7-bisphosphate phosphatase
MKLIILDRDGVINQASEHFIKSPAEWKPLPGRLDAIARLTQAGYKIAIATNQSGVGRGFFTMATLNAIHVKMIKAAQEAGGRIDAVFYCPHTMADGCHCRKPAPGMLEEIGQRFQVALSSVIVVGDSLRDLQAAAAVGAKPCLVCTGKGARMIDDAQLPPDTQVFDDLSACVNALIQ